MTFPSDITIDLSQTGITGIQNPTIKIVGGITTFLGPNGAGNTQLFRGLKSSLSSHVNGKKSKYVSAGRLGQMENFGSDFDGQRGTPILAMQNLEIKLQRQEDIKPAILQLYQKDLIY